MLLLVVTAQLIFMTSIEYFLQEREVLIKSF